MSQSPANSASLICLVLTLTPVGPPLQVQDDLSKASSLMSAKDFRERIDGLKAVEAIVPNLAFAPEGPLVQLLDNLTVGGALFLSSFDYSSKPSKPMQLLEIC